MAATSFQLLKEKLTSMAEVLIRERLNVLAAVLASNGASAEKQHLLLDKLVVAIRESKLEPHLVDGQGHPIPADLCVEEEGSEKKSTIVFNETMLRSLSEIKEEMLVEALATPIAKMLELTRAMVTIVLHERDEERLRELSVKLLGTVDSEVINFAALRSVQSFMLQRFFHRIAKVSEILSGGTHADVVPNHAKGMPELMDHIATFDRWPDWKAVRGNEADNMSLPQAQPLNQVVQNTCQALSQTVWLPHAIKIIKIVWNCSDLAHRSFLVEAGRKLRSMEVVAPANVLMAIAEAVGSDSRELSLRLEAWPRFDELERAMQALSVEESSLFGAATQSRGQSKPVSVVDIASRAFGMHEPEELPWSMPLLCWTQRETDALRDLFLGKCKTTFGTASRASCRRTYDFSWHGTGKSALTPGMQEEMPAVQVVPVGSSDLPGLAQALSVGEPVALDVDEGPELGHTLVEKCWKASFKTLKNHFATLDPEHRVETIEAMREFYNLINPHMEESWDRRFSPVMTGSTTRAFSILSRELGDMMGKPFLIDPFESVESADLLETPRLVVISAIVKRTKVAVVWIPLMLLAATKTIGSLIVRLVEARDPEEGEEEPSYIWLRDIPIHIDVFSGHPKDVIFQCIYGDSLQLVLSL